MGKKSTIYAFLILLIIGITSCSDDKDDPKPAAQSAFSQNRKVLEVNETVTFTNNSTNATRYEWDFGNGQTSTSQNASATYPNTGTYTVKLTSYNSENVANTTSSIVKVGERYLTAIKINKLNFSNATGSNWDFNNGPDLIFRLGKSASSTWDYNLDLGADYTQVMLPKLLSLQTPIKFTNENWDFKLEDFDTPDPNDDMAVWQGNPITVIEKNYETGKGSFKLTGTQLEIEMMFEVK